MTFINLSTGSGIPALGTDLPFVFVPLPTGGDDTPMIMDYVSTHYPLGEHVCLRNATYRIDTELQFSGLVPGVLEGVPHNYASAGGTVLSANTLGMRSVMALLGYSQGVFRYFKISANHKADYAVFFDNASSNEFTKIRFCNGVLDGLHFSSSGVNQNNQFYFPLIDTCGTLYVTAGLSGQYTNSKTVIAGTATTVAGNATITIVGGPDMTTFRIRPGCLIRIGASRFTAFYGEIASVTSTTVVVNPIFGTKGMPATTASGLDFAIGVGDGVHHEAFAGNGYSNFTGGAIRSNGNAGVYSAVLYGDTYDTTLIDFANLANVQIGAQNVTTMGGLFENVYMEGSSGVHYWMGSVQNIRIEVPTGDDPFIWNVAPLGNTGTLCRGGLEESIDTGRRQNFALMIRENAGALQVQYFGDWIAGAAVPAYVDRIANMPTTWTAIPSVNAAAGFGSVGCGILSTATNVLLFDNATDQNIFGRIDGEVVVEGNTTGSNYRATPSILSTNINGVTKPRMTLRLINGGNAAGGTGQMAWDTTTIPAGTEIILRVSVAMR